MTTQQQWTELKLYKTVDMEIGALQSEDDQYKWISLGYYDYIKINQLENTSPLDHEGVDENRNNCKTVYTVNSTNKDLNFSKKDTNYLFVTMLIKKTSDNREIKQIEDYISVGLKKRKLDQLIEFRIDKAFGSVDYIVYWHSDKLGNAWDAISQICALGEFESCNTIPNVKYNLVKDKSNGIEKNKLGGFVTRYTVKNFSNISKFKKFIDGNFADKDYRTINGDKDLILHCKECTEKDLINLLHYYLFDEGDFCYTTFCESETNLLAPIGMLDTQHKNTDTKQDVVPYNYNNMDITKFNQLDQTWINSLKHHSNLLFAKNSKMFSRPLYFIMHDPLNMILEKIKKHISNNETIPDEQTEYYQKFTRGCGKLIHEFYLANENFSTYPEFNSNTYDICVSLQEFYAAFSKSCIKIMSEKIMSDYIYNKNSHKYCFLIAPKICRKMKVFSVFNSPPPADILLFIDMPIHMLKKPLQIMSLLCHELSHHYSDSWRLREDRMIYLAQSYAKIVLTKYKLKSTEVVNHANFLIKKEIEKKIIEKADDKEFYFADFLHRLNDIVFNIIFEHTDALLKKEYETLLKEDAETCDKFLQDFCNASGLRGLNKYYKNDTEYVENSGSFLDILEKIFKECYADIAMINILGLTEDEYFGLFEDDMIDFLKEFEKLELEKHKDKFKKKLENDSYQFLVARVGFVSVVAFKKKNSKDTKAVETTEDTKAIETTEDTKVVKTRMLSDDIDKFKENIVHHNNDNADFPFLDHDIAKYISSYLDLCDGKIKESLSSVFSDKKINEVKEVFEKVGRGKIVGDKFYNDFIDNYRNGILKSSRKKTSNV